MLFHSSPYNSPMASCCVWNKVKSAITSRPRVVRAPHTLADLGVYYTAASAHTLVLGFLFDHSYGKDFAVAVSLYEMPFLQIFLWLIFSYLDAFSVYC